MNTKKKLTGMVLASAVAATFAMAPASSALAGDKMSADSHVKCMGVNSCKGHSSCSTAKSSCKGKNSCKGHGFVKVSKGVCDQLGGKSVAKED